jgi:hypothetical protein
MSWLTWAVCKGVQQPPGCVLCSGMHQQSAGSVHLVSLLLCRVLQRLLLCRVLRA